MLNRYPYDPCSIAISKSRPHHDHQWSTYMLCFEEPFDISILPFFASPSHLFSASTLLPPHVLSSHRAEPTPITDWYHHFASLRVILED